ncbi:extracellular sialidase/neuraminidase [Metarhizium album ARSEF 1941]|uniref:Extracellular sialidase/neuraminidase n=1 Tax=Metarhizium album (strain ARSEF 1941) TaxID=1081103 RepID=A0A0B2WJJ5_METAS|nr:extracellular sialidase/neuraminidase [Metarhizium album ARSEF 1941]KHN96201.1 extracellular sialidase/neuraminidase [Metarhizium album ARSEF 1941]
MRGPVLLGWLAAALGAGLASAAAAFKDIARDTLPYHREFVLFKSANMPRADKLPNGVAFHSFMVPAVVTTVSGRILAFAEGRRYDNRNLDDVRIVFKRTKDGAKDGAKEGARPEDWEDLQELVLKAGGVWGNPTPVVDGQTIYLFMNWHDREYSQHGRDRLHTGRKTRKVDKSWKGRRHLFLTQSTDDGKTWTEPQDVTKQLTPRRRAWDAVGPGNGIVLLTNEIVVPAMGRNIVGRGPPGVRSWTYKELPGSGPEGTIVQTPNGMLYRNDRGKDEIEYETDRDRLANRYRRVARGDLRHFPPFSLDKELPDPVCAAAMLLYNHADAKEPARVVFLNSADQATRRAMRVRISYDKEAKKFLVNRKLSDAPVVDAGFEGGYSSLTKTADTYIGALVETNFDQTGGTKSDFRAIIWRKFNLSWILHGR